MSTQIYSWSNPEGKLEAVYESGKLDHFTFEKAGQTTQIALSNIWINQVPALYIKGFKHCAIEKISGFSIDESSELRLNTDQFETIALILTGLGKEEIKFNVPKKLKSPGLKEAICKNLKLDNSDCLSLKYKNLPLDESNTMEDLGFENQTKISVFLPEKERKKISEFLNIPNTFCQNSPPIVKNSTLLFSKETDASTSNLREIEKNIYSESTSTKSQALEMLDHLVLTISSTSQFNSSHIDLYKKIIELQISGYGENHSTIAKSYNNIGFSLHVLGEHQEAIEYYTKALKIQQKIFDENHPDLAKSYNNLGTALCAVGKTKEGLANLKRSLKIRIELYGENHLDVATSYNNLGLAYYALGNKEKALNYCCLSLATQEDIGGEENYPNLVPILKTIQSILDSMGMKEDAQLYQNQLTGIQNTLKV